MIVRILGEGQYEIDDSDRRELDKLDTVLVEAVDTADETSFGPALHALTSEVRRVGQLLPDDHFAPSDLVVPFADATLAETQRLLADSSTADEG